MTSLLHLLQVCQSSIITCCFHLSLCIGCAISWDGHFNLQTEHDSFSTVLDLVLNCACFVYIGAWLPFDKFHISEIGVTPWRLVILVLIILALRRIPSLLLLYKLMPEVANWREALFCGHFGPVSAFHFHCSYVHF
jgi:NhaP-type Na+/H+ or K+/H+ antiporter